jgi:hypothetical protein
LSEKILEPGSSSLIKLATIDMLIANDINVGDSLVRSPENAARVAFELSKGRRSTHRSDLTTFFKSETFTEKTAGRDGSLAMRLKMLKKNSPDYSRSIS